MITLNSLYWLVNSFALSGWVVLFFYPIVPVRLIRFASIWVPIGLSVGYLIAIIFALPTFGGGFESLDSLIKLFSQPVAVLAGWIHYLAFDLFVGGWQVRRARQLELPIAAVVPCLLLTLFFGPIGFLVFYTLQWWWRNKEPVSGDQPVARHHGHLS